MLYSPPTMPILKSYWVSKLRNLRSLKEGKEEVEEAAQKYIHASTDSTKNYISL
jgi:hypothetical protein